MKVSLTVLASLVGAVDTGRRLPRSLAALFFVVVELTTA